MFGKQENTEIVVTPAGLVRLFRILHRKQGLSAMALGPSVTAFAQTNDNFLVTLSDWQTKALLSEVPGASIEWLVNQEGDPREEV